MFKWLSIGYLKGYMLCWISLRLHIINHSISFMKGLHFKIFVGSVHRPYRTTFECRPGLGRIDTAL